MLHQPDSILVGITHVAEAIPELNRLEFHLSMADCARATRFRRTEDRARFVLGRRLLACLLRDRLGYKPIPLNLRVTEKGQPYLADKPEVNFSISHAGELVAVALSIGAPVGIDVEALDRKVDLLPLAERILSADDLARFHKIPAANQPRAFFRAWTGKEAVLKAKGIGLFGGVQEISVPFGDNPATMLENVDGPKTMWRLTPLDLGDDHVGVVAASEASSVAAIEWIRAADLT
jgi:4'-phosphopantetheinyl transferase